ncbi:hypothetical protein [Pseudomonas sp. MF6747]|uniref:hypothetical protein n=1 Tax=Pseudomonas sp. MF6747 TaxID=2797527 RepID=UPI00190CB4B3|nr:hypothetical protein [Pseudomonas sp. MF6747]MBK3506634.1 hypothetical protein [Pseudomonas sp. MF6747]
MNIINQDQLELMFDMTKKTATNTIKQAIWSAIPSESENYKVSEIIESPTELDFFFYFRREIQDNDILSAEIIDNKTLKVKVNLVSSSALVESELSKIIPTQYLKDITITAIYRQTDYDSKSYNAETIIDNSDMNTIEEMLEKLKDKAMKYNEADFIKILTESSHSIIRKIFYKQP